MNTKTKCLKPTVFQCKSTTVGLNYFLKQKQPVFLKKTCESEML